VTTAVVAANGVARLKELENSLVSLSRAEE
jgi:hypothetical protein